MKTYAGENTLSAFSTIVKKSIAEAGSGTGFTPDDTLTLSDGTLGVTTPVQGVYTQAEFDALPEAQKNKGLYVISDGENGGSNAGEIYSTEETVIGSWIDGRPLYRKTWVAETPSEIGAYKPIVSEDPVFYVINALPRTYGFVAYNTGNLPPINMYVTNTNYIGTWFLNRKIQCIIGGAGWANKTIYITLEYTKTTDQAM